MARKVGLEPTSTGSEPAVLPLDYFRIFWRAISESNRAFEVCNLVHSLSVNGSYLIKMTVKSKSNRFTNIIIIDIFKLSSIKPFSIRFPLNLMSLFKVYLFFHGNHLSILADGVRLELTHAFTSQFSRLVDYQLSLSIQLINILYHIF